ncbi:nucleotidyltransferase family protein [Shewanella waksmanii]|uniref:nucleotidyltransferase family protein n=1 Tax=Shewanella waksmanii TaxID=213783 RepID=UPI0037351CB2
MTSASSSKLLITLLAAGASRRFGSPKQLATLGRKSLLQHKLGVLNEVCARSNAELVIVLGANEILIRDALINDATTPPVSMLSNPDWSLGMASSIKCAVRYAQVHNYSRLLVCLADQIALTVDDYLSMLAASNHRRVAAYFEQRIGAPALFLKQDYPELLTLQGDVGAKALLKQLYQTGNLVACAKPQASIDIDTQAQLISWQNKQKHNNKVFHSPIEMKR